MDEIEQIREKKRQEMLKGGPQGADWPAEPAEVNDGTFNDFIKKYSVVVVDCWAPWCGPCRMMSPVIDALAKEMQGKIAFGKLNTDMNPKVAMRFQIEAIPTLLVLKDGELVERLVGAKPKEDLARRLRAHL
ncbi:MAG: thioredoxin [Methanomassiliicoccus sp.]|nr:thioredoxin [Methanomassiliicoccus sp.]